MAVRRISSNAMQGLMEIHGPENLTASRLHIGKSQEPHFQSRADRFPPVGGAQLPEDVVKVGFDRRWRQTKVGSHSFGRVALGDASENLHLPRCKGDQVALGQRS